MLAKLSLFRKMPDGCFASATKGLPNRCTVGRLSFVLGLITLLAFAAVEFLFFIKPPCRSVAGINGAQIH